jgi:hypothetical protein
VQTRQLSTGLNLLDVNRKFFVVVYRVFTCEE